MMAVYLVNPEVFCENNGRAKQAQPVDKARIPSGIGQDRRLALATVEWYHQRDKSLQGLLKISGLALATGWCELEHEHENYITGLEEVIPVAEAKPEIVCNPLKVICCLF